MPRGRPCRSTSAAVSLDRAWTRGTATITVHMATQTEASSSSPATAADLAAATQTIATAQTVLMDKIDHLQTNVDFIRRDLDSFCCRVVEVEQRVSTGEDSIRDHAGNLHTLKVKVKMMETCAEDYRSPWRC